MPYTAWATAAEIQTLAGTIEGVDITALDDEVLDSAVARAVLEAERYTGWVPLLASDTATAQVFRAPNGLSGQVLLALPSPIQEDAVVTVDFDPIEDTGTLLTIYQDWWPFEEAINVVEFLSAPVPGPKKVKISQKWGRFVDEIPADFWSAVALMAIAIVLSETQGSNASAIEFSQDSVRFRFSEKAFSGSSFASGGPHAVNYSNRFKEVCAQYARIWSS